MSVALTTSFSKSRKGGIELRIEFVFVQQGFACLAQEFMSWKQLQQMTYSPWKLGQKSQYEMKSLQY